MTKPSSEWTGLAAALVESERYRPLQRLGKKAGRQTLLCEDRETGQRVVIKLLSFGEDFAWDDLKLFEREAETLRSLDHPAIPQYLDYFDLETPRTKGFALVQSYIEARSLQQQLKAGRSFSEAEIQQIGEDLLRILEYLHGRQPPVIHRDIKPSNILLGDRSAHSPGKVYLVDFGSVQTLAAREGGTVTVVGTYGYMPPEQFGGRAVPASDLYSLGATLIYLASGKHPADLPQKDFRIQFEEQVQLTPQAIAWLQLLIEPSLEQRPISAVQASLRRIRPQRVSAPRLRVIGRANTALSLKPTFSKIKSNYTSTGELKLVLPGEQVTLTQLDNPLRKGGCFGIFLLSWGGLAGCLITLLGITVISTPLLWMLFLSQTGMPLVTAWLGWIFFLLPIGLIPYAIFSSFSSKSLILISLDERKIQIQYSRQKIISFSRHDVRLFPVSSTQEMAFFKFLIGSYQLEVYGHINEIHWLEQVLRDELELPMGATS